MKKSFLVILLVLVIGLTGCGRKAEEAVETTLDPDFRIIEATDFLHLDAGLTRFENLKSPEFLWKIDGKEMTGETIKISVPGEIIEIKLTVKAVDPEGEPVIAKKAIEYDPFESEKYAKVRIIDHYRLKGVKWYFKATSPPEAAYWLWRFPGEDYWHVYERNDMSYSFPEKGSQKVRLRIWDEEMKDIGEEYSTYVKVK